MNEKIFFVGNCSASSIVVGLKEFQKEEDVYSDLLFAYWAMPAELFLKPFHFESEGRCVLFNGEKPSTLNAEEQDNFFIYDIAKFSENDPKNEMGKLSRWRFLPKYATIPLFKDEQNEFVYCFCGSTFPYRFIWQMFLDHIQCKSFITEGIIESCVSHYMKEQIALFKKLKQRDLRLVSVEGPRYLPVDKTFAKYYPELLNIMKYAMNCMTHEIKSVGVPVISMPDEMFDGRGFMDSKYRIRDTDALHTNSCFGRKRFIQVMEALKNFSWV